MKMKMQLSNNLKMFVGTLFGAIGFRGLRYVIMCLTLISSVFLKKKKKIALDGTIKLQKLFLE